MIPLSMAQDHLADEYSRTIYTANPNVTESEQQWYQKKLWTWDNEVRLAYSFALIQELTTMAATKYLPSK